MFFDNGAEKIDCFLNVGIIKFFKFLYEDIEHRNGYFCFFSFKGVNVFIFLFFIKILFLFCKLAVYHSDFLFYHVLNEHE